MVPETGPPCDDDRLVGVHVGANVGLFAIDLQKDHFYAMLAMNAGVPLLSNNSFGAGSFLIGYSTDLRRSAASAWKVDMLLQITPGWQRDWLSSYYGGGISNRGFVGVGATVGFRYERKGGFSLGIRIPVFGYAFGGSGSTTAEGVGMHFLASVVSLPVLSFGYRFP